MKESVRNRRLVNISFYALLVLVLVGIFYNFYSTWSINNQNQKKENLPRRELYKAADVKKNTKLLYTYIVIYGVSNYGANFYLDYPKSSLPELSDATDWSKVRNSVNTHKFKIVGFNYTGTPGFDLQTKSTSVLPLRKLPMFRVTENKSVYYDAGFYEVDKFNNYDKTPFHTIYHFVNSYYTKAQVKRVLDNEEID
ncbi:hypothetical protein [Furfurilactobacillus milii]|uniref:Uncharacterized protein n=1 Tax=Furfurilactobacillus milii TaxID=2888272 RepID=A0A6N9I4A3_9LACO|nr:hypothetical protein [Furfurilactobacillus milii]MYV17246.1 hypothetical protein [Furfurilactobacillus milii]